MSKSGRSLLTTKIKKPKLQSFVLYLWFFNLVFLTVVRYILSTFGLNGGLTRELILWAVASIPLIVCLLNYQSFGAKRIVPFLLLFGVIIIAFCITALFNSEAAPFLFRENYGLVRLFRPDAALYAALFFLLPDDAEELKKNITVYAYLRFAFEIVFSLLPAIRQGYWTNVGSSGQEIHLSYSLTFGYTMCFPTIVFMYRSIKEKKLIHIFMALAGLWCIITNGSRGAILIPVIFVALMLVSGIMENRHSPRKLLKYAALVIALLLVFILRDYLLQWGVSLLNKMDIGSRTVNMLLGGRFSEDNGRQAIWRASFEAIKTGKLFGYGVYGDRPFVAPIHYVGYSHNLFLELLVSFGIIGAGIIIRIVYDSVQMIFVCKDQSWRELYIVFFSISCQLLLSLSFWYVWSFWAAIAIAYNYRHFQQGKLNNRL